ncbi:MAG: SPOR domain-containing protein [Bacteroidia bacterium]|nr:SPOR domain-containing protein [Bacteroidia bacterium]
MRYAAIVLPTLLSLCISAHALNYRSFSFYEGSFDQLRKEAFEESRPYILYFSFKGNDDCKGIENYTFQDGKLGELIQQHFLIYEIDESWTHKSDRYKAVDFEVNKPSFLIFDEYSKQQAEISGFVSPETLYEQLQNFLPERGASRRVEIQQEDGESSTSRRELGDFFFEEAEVQNYEGNAQPAREGIMGSQSDGIIIEDLQEQREEAQPETYSSQATSSNFVKEETYLELDPVVSQRFDFEEEVDGGAPHQRKDIIQEFNAEKERVSELALINPDWQEKEEASSYEVIPDMKEENGNSFDGYGIQTGAFEQSYFMRSHVEYLQQTFGKNVFINKEENSGKALYKVQVGPFTTETEARAFQEQYRAATGTQAGFLVYLR